MSISLSTTILDVLTQNPSRSRSFSVWNVSSLALPLSDVMRSERSRNATRKHSQPRRTHKLGGCSTCRRRHVKCDQSRPCCSVCRNAGLQCEGFPSQIRWASMSTGPPALKSAQIPPPTPSAQRQVASQSTTASQDASSTEPDQRLHPIG